MRRSVSGYREHPFNTYSGMGCILPVFANDHNDTLPPNNYVYNVETGGPLLLSHSWCLGNARLDTTTSNIENGLLFSYNRSPAIYHCPSDKSTVKTATGEKLSRLRTRSYNMSLSVNGVPTLAGLPPLEQDRARNFLD